MNGANLCEAKTSSTLRGVAAAVLSNGLFSILFLYSMWMQPLSGTDVFAWRMIGMLFALLALMSLSRSWGAARSFAAGLGMNLRNWLPLLLTTPIIASQLWLFMWAPVNGEGINVAMGYFLFPLAMMLAGRIWLKERLNRLQSCAVLLAAAGVGWQLVHSGAFSWATLWVCGTYPVYYLLRRRFGIPSLIGLTIDLALIAPCMLVYILLSSESLAVIAAHPQLAVWIVLLGINSALAMYLNLQANQMLPVVIFGMLSYLEPILLFVLSVVLLNETVSSQDWIGYGLIWSGLCLLLLQGLLYGIRQRCTNNHAV
ncbi:EamA family transporter RarD [Neisseria sp. ZJ106]|uniref:EamA family transporter RarD n=1 Tax=Neisseria lisongii TaxID=2912188 RepID=A0ABY7RHH6_9NEIS|nr:EamA family transporter RarD [Neisseria lisongii]MCF7522225.1 EamA family transporter RarD [Neisseria lisongii]WCL71084.1 EamA family transporter RarD [Neisseria lisongii]